MLKLALIGAGSMAKNYLNTLEKIKGAVIVTVVAKTHNNLKKLPSKYLKTTRIEDIWSQKLNGIIISTPASTHFTLASVFLKQGFNILIEKPLTANLKDAQKLKNIKTKGKLMVGHTLLFHPAYKTLKQLLKNQKILSITFEGYNNVPRKDTSLLWDWGSHPASIFLDLLQSFPTKISAEKFKKDELILNLGFKNAVSGIIKIGWNSKIKRRKLVVSTIENIYTFDDMKYPKLEVCKQNNFSIIYPKIKEHQPLEDEIYEFIRLINKKRVVSDLDFGIKVVKLLDMCQKSYTKRK